MWIFFRRFFILGVEELYKVKCILCDVDLIPDHFTKRTRHRKSKQEKFRSGKSERLDNGFSGFRSTVARDVSTTYSVIILCQKMTTMTTLLKNNTSPGVKNNPLFTLINDFSVTAKTKWHRPRFARTWLLFVLTYGTVYVSKMMRKIHKSEPRFTGGTLSTRPVFIFLPSSFFVPQIA